MSSQPLGKFPLIGGVFCGIALGALLMALMPLSDIHPVFALVVPFLCVLILLLVTKPRVILVALLMSRALLDPLLNLTKGSASLGFGAVLNLLVVMVAVFLFMQKPSSLTRSPFFKPWMIFLAICAASVAYSPVPLLSAKMAFTLTSYLCMALLPMLLATDVDDRKFWIKVLVASTVLPVLFADLDMVRGGSSFTDAGSRILGTFTHPNILAFYLLWAVALIFFTLKCGMFRLSALSKIFLFGLMMNCLALIVATKTRNAWIGTWLLFFSYGVLKEKKYVFLSLGLLAAALGVSDVSARITDLFEYRTHQVNSWAWRVDVWKSGLAWIGNRWPYGFGLASFHELSRQFLYSERTGVEAHNAYFQLLFETGAAGLLAYVAVFWKLIGALRMKIKNSVGRLSSGYAIALCYTGVYLLTGIADNILYYLALNWYCWFFWGVLLKPVKLKQAPRAGARLPYANTWRPRPVYAKADR